MLAPAPTSPGGAVRGGSMRSYDKLFIGGQWVAPAGSATIEVRSPATLEVVGVVPEAVEADVDAAVAAARAAFDSGPWPRSTPAERGAVIAKAGELLAARGDDFCQAISDEMGAPLATVNMMQYTPASVVFAVQQQLVDTFPWEETRNGMFGVSRVRREPVGVVAAIIPWNVPLFIAINKLAP